MRCVAFCTAERYQLQPIANLFRKQGIKCKFHRDVLHVDYANDKNIFFFSLGSFVTWGLKRQEEKTIVDLIQEFKVNPIQQLEEDRFIFRYGETTTIETHERLNADMITLENDDVQIKLAISYGLAQSVKLEAYEESVQKTIKDNEDLPRHLAKKGSIHISSKEISKRMGEIFLERSSVNLSSEYLDMPEYFWQYPSLESYYVITEKYLDLSNRVASLNQRLDVLHELFDMLTSQRQHRHSSILEIIIIILILIEIVMGFFHFQLF